jgi:hypothetical protein
LNNVRQSWGSVRKKDGAVFLRVWQDECQILEGGRFVVIDLLPEAMKPEYERPGRDERRRHIALIEAGAPAYMVMCLAKDPATADRTIKSVDSDFIFVGGRIVRSDGRVWRRARLNVNAPAC